MGEAKRKNSATEKLIEKYPSCFFCGGINPSETREHMPPKALFDGSHQPDDHVMPSCRNCNNKTSTADLVAAIMTRWDVPPTDAEIRDTIKLNPQISLQAPEIVSEWLEPLGSGLQSAKHLEMQGVQVPLGAKVIAYGPETIRQLNVFSHKVVLGLYFENTKDVLPPDGAVFSYWRTKEDSQIHQIPKSFTDLLPKFATLRQGNWAVQSTFNYRYNISTCKNLFSCVVNIRGRFSIVGCVVRDISMLPDKTGWARPNTPENLLQDHVFCERR